MPAHAVHLYFYTDSVAFPRRGIQRLSETYPLLVEERVKRAVPSGISVRCILRGLGGARIQELAEILHRDFGYLPEAAADTASYYFFNSGIVDCAPQPFTYHLRALRRLPFLGPLLWPTLRRNLIKFRPLLQRIWSFRLTRPRPFMKTLNSMIASVAAVGGRSVVLLTPRPPDAMESRSPGITSSVEKYNSMKKDSPANVLVLSVEALEAELLLDDGHHLTTRGHEQVAALIWEALRPDLIPTLEPQQFQHQRGPMERC